MLFCSYLQKKLFNVTTLLILFVPIQATLDLVPLNMFTTIVFDLNSSLQKMHNQQQNLIETGQAFNLTNSDYSKTKIQYKQTKTLINLISRKFPYSNEKIEARLEKIKIYQEITGENPLNQGGDIFLQWSSKLTAFAVIIWNMIQNNNVDEKYVKELLALGANPHGTMGLAHEQISFFSYSTKQYTTITNAHVTPCGIAGYYRALKFYANSAETILQLFIEHENNK